MNIRKVAAIAVATAYALLVSAQASADRIDADLFATYKASQHISISFTVCGSLPDERGCFGSSGFAPFEYACAILEGVPKYNGGVVKRDVYVLDRRASRGVAVKLFVFQRKDVITDQSDTVTTALKQTISLPIKGGPGADCSMAANNVAVYAGTSKDHVAVSIDKNTYALTTVGGFSPPEALTAITADERGYVTLRFSDGNLVFGPQGQEVSVGGGVADMIDDHNATWKVN